MNTNPTYFYRLGHSPDFGVAEYEILTGDKPTKRSPSYILAGKELNVNITGSLVFGGIVHHSWASKPSLDDVKETLRTLWPTIIGDTKKVGLSLFGIKSTVKEMIQLAKDLGGKKVNVIFESPAFGHWKQTKNWLMLLEIAGGWHLGLVQSFCNQEFWSKLDSSFPAGDMARGLINLKLARTLVNFSTTSKVIDPFAGAGRLLVAGMDRKSEMAATDIDADCYMETRLNWDYGDYFFGRNYHFLNNGEYKPAKMAFNQTLDATALETLTELDGPNTSLVTEGYLGTNFRQKPKLEEIQKEFQVLQAIWNKVLTAAAKIKLAEIVFCLPAYSNQQLILPDFLDDMVNRSDYKFELLANQKHLIYARKDSLVSHLVIKLVRK